MIRPDRLRGRRLPGIVTVAPHHTCGVTLVVTPRRAGRPVDLARHCKPACVVARRICARDSDREFLKLFGLMRVSQTSRASQAGDRSSPEGAWKLRSTCHHRRSAARAAARRPPIGRRRAARERAGRPTSSATTATDCSSFPSRSAAPGAPANGPLQLTSATRVRLVAWCQVFSRKGCERRDFYRSQPSFGVRPRHRSTQIQACG